MCSIESRVAACSRTDTSAPSVGDVASACSLFDAISGSVLWSPDIMP